ncbi:MAG: YbaK/EbsC family protein [Streptosporangiales bacterium]|nr:YbaK/EbsC family protein [Streptosporangiales bacterium]
MGANTDRVEEILRDHGMHDRVRRFDEAVPTAAAAAETLGCEVGAIANSLIFTADGEPLLVLASGAHRVDRKRVAALVGAAKVRQATPEQVLAATGQEVGGVAPVGHPRTVHTLVDVWLAKHDEIWAGAGEHASMFRSTFDELIALTGGEPAEIA